MFFIFRSKNKECAEINAASSSAKTKGPSKWTAIKVVALTTGCFVVTWVPFLIASTWHVFCDDTETPDLCLNIRVAIASPLSILGFTNGLWNPIIYAWWHNGFRESVKKIYGRLCCRRRPDNLTMPSTSSSAIATTTTTTTAVANTLYKAAPYQSDSEIMDSDCGSLAATGNSTEWESSTSLDADVSSKRISSRSAGKHKSLPPPQRQADLL